MLLFSQIIRICASGTQSSCLFQIIRLYNNHITQIEWHDCYTILWFKTSKKIKCLMYIFWLDVRIVDIFTTCSLMTSLRSNALFKRSFVILRLMNRRLIIFFVKFTFFTSFEKFLPTRFFQKHMSIFLLCYIIESWRLNVKNWSTQLLMRLWSDDESTLSCTPLTLSTDSASALKGGDSDYFSHLCSDFAYPSILQRVSSSGCFQKPCP